MTLHARPSVFGYNLVRLEMDLGIRIVCWYTTFNLKCHKTSKLHHPENVTVCFYQPIPMNITLKISPQGKGLAVVQIMYARALYVHTNRLINEALYTSVCHSL